MNKFYQRKILGDLNFELNVIFDYCPSFAWTYKSVALSLSERLDVAPECLSLNISLNGGLGIS